MTDPADRVDADTVDDPDLADADTAATDADDTDRDADDTAPGAHDADSDDRADPYAHLRETELAPLVEAYGELDLSTRGDLFERLVVSIVRQRISTAQADRIVARLRERGEITPETTLAADEEELRALGLSGPKIEYARNAARWWRDREPTREAFAAMTDEEVAAELTEIRGVGEWTAEMVLMLGLERPDVFPVGDLAVRRGVESLVGDGADADEGDGGSGDDAGDGELTRAEIRDVAEAWRPYRSYATLYLWWRYVDENLNIEPESLTL